MGERVKTYVEAQLPEKLVEDFLRYVREWDQAHPGCGFKIGMQASGMPKSEMKRILDKINLFPMEIPREH